MSHDIKVKACYTHETTTLPMTDHMTKQKGRQTVRRCYLDVLKLVQNVGGSLAKLSTAKVYSGALVE